MTKEEIAEYLNHPKQGENRRKLVAFCREPRNFNEMKRSGVKGDLFKVLVELKTLDALEFANGKYSSSQEAIEVLDSIQ
jgi:hypothetical protein